MPFSAANMGIFAVYAQVLDTKTEIASQIADPLTKQAILSQTPTR
jgi:hypothetical protein